MKKGKIIILAVLVILILAAVFIFSMVGPMMSMKPKATGRIDKTDIIAVRNMSNNIYLIPLSEGYILIDAGSESDSVIKSLEELSISSNDIKHIFITHSDYDHVAALDRFDNAQIYMSVDEKQMVDGTTKRNGSSNKLPDGVKLEDITLLEDGEKLSYGERTIECIASTGHTKGSMSYLLDDKYLFTGDAFKVSNGEVSVHPYTMDSKMAEQTIKKLADVFDECELILTAHYGFFNSEFEK